MDIAFCTKDDLLYDAAGLKSDASKQLPKWLIDRRQTFVCPSCEEKVGFVDSGSSGRIPHFRVVRQHDLDCDYYNDPTSGGKKTGTGNPVNAHYNAGGNKEVRYDAPGPLFPQAGPPGQAGKGAGKKATAAGVSHSLPASGVPLAHETTGLSRILTNLRNRPDYPPAGLYFDVTARGPAVLASDYLHKFVDLTRDMELDDVTRAYWGKISSVHEYGDLGKEALWINCDGIGSIVTIRVGHDLKNDLLKALGISKLSQLTDSHVIVEGILKRAKKLSINVTEIKKMAFRPKR